MQRILERINLNRLSRVDRRTGRVMRRYERSTAGELVHLDKTSAALLLAGLLLSGCGDERTSEDVLVVGVAPTTKHGISPAGLECLWRQASLAKSA
ncbi:MAG: hypothetical protein OXC58_03945 [Acidimicrobiaceae bacterium]|nr:hypothetical protein [Acidimicrobiaceae bacterium]MCY4293976.1 hypothetical protein [Acidimicrobiaceae bacterium]